MTAYLLNVAKVLPGLKNNVYVTVVPKTKQNQTKQVPLGGTSFLYPENGLALSPRAAL